jgi:hypothetical protein
LKPISGKDIRFDRLFAAGPERVLRIDKPAAFADPPRANFVKPDRP